MDLVLLVLLLRLLHYINQNNLILVGAMANNFIKFKGNNVGKSLIEDDSDKMIKEMAEWLLDHSVTDT